MFLIVIFSAPACLLSFYLAYLCYRRARYPHALVLALVAVIMLVVTLGVLGAGYFAGQAIEVESAACYPWSPSVIV